MEYLKGKILDNNPLQRLASLVCLGLVGGVALSWSLWTNDREFPLFALSSPALQLQHPLDKILLAVLILCAFAMITRPNRAFALGILGSIAVLALQDQQRWQPWFYQYALMLLPFLLYRWKKDTPIERDNIIALQQCIVIAIYFWSGIHKCNPGFINAYNNSLLAPVLDKLNGGFLAATIKGFAYLIPPIEALAAIGLAFLKTRRLAIVAVIAMHLVILTILGPIQGKISNSVVWPWNIAMIAAVLCLFSRSKISPFQAYWKSRQKLVAAVVLLLMVPAPALFHIDRWDRYLSFNLYTGQQKRIYVKIDADQLPLVPDEWLPFIQSTKAADGHHLFAPSRWARETLNVPLVTEWRILRQLSRHICATLDSETPLQFYIDYTHRPDKPQYFYTCEQIDELNGRNTLAKPNTLR